MPCEAEAPYADAIAYCRLPAGHLAHEHEGLIETPCEACGRRSCHTDQCPTPEASANIERVRWEGSPTPMPELTDPFAKTAMKAMIEAREKADVIFWVAIGSDVKVRDFLATAREWGQTLHREGDRTACRMLKHLPHSDPHRPPSPPSPRCELKVGHPGKHQGRDIHSRRLVRWEGDILDLFDVSDVNA